MSNPFSVWDRFWSKVEKTDHCWNWTGWCNDNGYGYFDLPRPRRGKVRAHALAYRWAYGLIPSGREPDHRCLNRRCVRPGHMRLVTHKQNGENRNGAYENSTSGVRGVRFEHGAWVASATHHGVKHYGGRFPTSQLAEDAAVALRQRLFTHSQEVDREGQVA